MTKNARKPKRHAQGTRNALATRRARASDSPDYPVSLDVLHLMRADPSRSLYKTAAQLGVGPRKVLQNVGSAYRKIGGRYRPTSSDRLRRELVFYNERGQVALVTHSSRQATRLAKYHNAVRAYVAFGDDSALSEFDGKSIVVHGKEYPFLTDRRVLNRLARAGELHFLEIYADRSIG